MLNKLKQLFVDKFLTLEIGLNSYATIDFKRYPHSYNNNPSKIEKSFLGETFNFWHEHGVLHRINGPAVVNLRTGGKCYVLNSIRQGNVDKHTLWICNLKMVGKTMGKDLGMESTDLHSPYLATSKSLERNS